jgi:cytochrome c oxidase assembly factor CtaG
MAGMALLVVVMAPPLETLARRYLFAESIQFCVLGIVGPALIVLGAPWRRTRLSRRPPGIPAGRPTAVLAGRPSFTTAAGFLSAWIGVCLVWRLPPVLDGLARHPALSAAELATLLPAGTCLWLELVNSPPFAPRLTRPRRAAIAALAMWSTWVIAYVLGFARGSVVHAYDGVGSSLPAVSDQEITAGILWLAAACCFLPVVFTSLSGWLKDGAGPGEELVSPGVTNPSVRGWGRRTRERSRPSA